MFRELGNRKAYGKQRVAYLKILLGLSDIPFDIRLSFLPLLADTSARVGKNHHVKKTLCLFDGDGTTSTTSKYH